MAAHYLVQLTLIVAAAGTEDVTAACARGPGRGGQEALDVNSFLQLVTMQAAGEGEEAGGAPESSARGVEPSPGSRGGAVAANKTEVLEHIVDGRVLGDLNRTVPWASTTVSFLDLAATDTALKGFTGGFTDGTYGYVVPYHNGVAHSGKVARFDLAGFAAVASLDLAATDTALKGFYGCFTDGTYGYAVPYYNSAYFGKVARFDLAGFAAVASLDLAATDAALTGFQGGFTDGIYGYAVPHKNAARHGKVARFDLAGFATVASFDLAATDTALKGFAGGFTDGTYGYVVPHHNLARHGKVARFDLAGFAAVASLDLAATDTALKGFRGGFTDGTYGYVVPLNNGARFGKVARFDLAGFAAVASLDLAATDAALKGFQGGFTDGTYGYVVPYDNGARFGKVARFRVSHEDPADETSVAGDPHVVNVAHARFDIRAAGAHKLAQIPRLTRANERPDLRVDAEIRHLVSNDCSTSFMTSLSVSGRWTEDAFGLLRISPGSDTPDTTLLINTQRPEEFFKQFAFPGVKAGRAHIEFKVRDITFHVEKHFEGRYGQQRAYLNLRIAGLRKYKDLGGLLGYDDHAAAEKPAANCTAAQPAAAQGSFIGNGRLAPSTDGGSRIESE